MLGQSALGAIFWGFLGAGATESWELYRAIHRVKDFPWKVPDEVPFRPFCIAFMIRLTIGAIVATCFVESGKAGLPMGALSIGIASPKLLEQLARNFLARSTGMAPEDPQPPPTLAQSHPKLPHSPLAPQPATEASDAS